MSKDEGLDYPVADFVGHKRRKYAEIFLTDLVGAEALSSLTIAADASQTSL